MKLCPWVEIRNVPGSQPASYWEQAKREEGREKALKSSHSSDTKYSTLILSHPMCSTGEVLYVGGGWRPFPICSVSSKFVDRTDWTVELSVKCRAHKHILENNNFFTEDARSEFLATFTFSRMRAEPWHKQGTHLGDVYRISLGGSAPWIILLNPSAINIK